MSTQPAAMLLNRDLSIVNIHDENGFSALQLAVMSGNEKMIKFLIKHGADIRTRDHEERTVVHWATGNDSLSSIRVLVHT